LSEWIEGLTKSFELTTTVMSLTRVALLVAGYTASITMGLGTKMLREARFQVSKLIGSVPRSMAQRHTASSSKIDMP